MINKFIEDEIIEISEVGEMNTYDINVDSEDHLFVANDILTHNCATGKEMAGLNSVSESSGTSMTADVILEIFENEEDTTLNYKRVGFAKNRYGPVNIAIVTKINYETLRITDLEEEQSYQSSLDKSVEADLNEFL